MTTVAEGTRTYVKFSIWLLAIDWIVFGSMHFSLRPATVAQIPPFLPLRDMIGIVTGIVEVATGILILVPETRKWAAMSSIALLILLIPAVIYILGSPAPLAATGMSPGAQSLALVVLVPHNILLGICSVLVMRNPKIPLIGERTSRTPKTASPPPRVELRHFSTLLPASILLLANCAGFLALLMGVPKRTAEASLWAMACIASGALIGFLFGVPRTNPNVKQRLYLLPNVNVEAVSDWLTKTLIGIGLVNCREIGLFVKNRSIELGTSIEMGQAFAEALIVYFFVVGIIQGYILTRIFLAVEFSRLLADPDKAEAA